MEKRKGRFMLSIENFVFLFCVALVVFVWVHEIKSIQSHNKDVDAFLNEVKVAQFDFVNIHDSSSTISSKLSSFENLIDETLYNKIVNDTDNYFEFTDSGGLKHIVEIVTYENEKYISSDVFEPLYKEKYFTIPNYESNSLMIIDIVHKKELNEMSLYHLMDIVIAAFLSILIAALAILLLSFLVVALIKK